MASKRVAFDWKVLHDQLEVDDTNPRPIFLSDAENQYESVRSARSQSKLWWTMIGLVLGVVLGGGYWLYCTAEAGATAREMELRNALVLDSYRIAYVAAKPRADPPVVQSLDLRDDMAAVKVVVNDPSRPSSYRETRFYQQTVNGWQRSPKAVRFWGASQHLESEHFVFHYRRQDIAAVTAAAPALDALYNRLYQALNRPTPITDEKMTVWVFAGSASEERDLPVMARSTIQVPSPGLLQIPADVSDAEVIALNVGISLIHQLLPRTSPSWLESNRELQGWWSQPLTEGLRLWLLWDTDPLLARWHRALLSSYFVTPCASCLRQPASLQADYLKSCQILDMLGLFRVEAFSVPCTGTFGSVADYSVADYTFLLPPQAPSNLSTLAPGTPTSQSDVRLLYKSYGGQIVLMAALLEYVEHTYGSEKVTVLLTAFGSYAQAETLFPAVFGISAEEFENEWRIYLAKQYGVAAL